jgi:hypothetical protein
MTADNHNAEQCNRCLENNLFYVFKMPKGEWEVRCWNCANRMHIFKQVEK